MKVHSEKNILDIPFSIQRLVAVSKYHRCLLPVDILHDRRNLRVALHQSFHKVVLVRKRRRCRHKHDQDCLVETPFLTSTWRISLRLCPYYTPTAQKTGPA